MKLTLLRASVVGAFTLASTLPSFGASKGTIDYRRDVQPIISGKCFQCHGPDEAARKAKLRLDIRDEALKDRKGTRAIVPGNLANSEAWKRITTHDEDDVMPPKKGGHPLTAAEIQILKQWIEQGAPYSEHWAFKKPERPALPKVKNAGWPKSAIDYFILARLEKAGLKPAPPADRATLIRRVSLDLTGLPPSPAEVDEFVNDGGANAYEKLVDRLLSTPAYGERWARVWLDLARYADSAGYGSDPLRLNIWPYRDWVIQAFNRNLPYDQFTLEQIAGDLLQNPTEEQLVATAFHRNTMTNTEGGTDREEFRVAAIKDRIATTMQVWMGLTFNCAQCHTHKYDPISNREYYQFLAIFNQTEDNDQPDERPTMPLPTKEQQARVDQLKSEIAKSEKEFANPTPEFLADLAEWENIQKRGIDWTVLEPTEIQSANGATLRTLEDKSILAEGTSPDKDTYTLKARAGAGNITAVRLEVLPDESLPKNGPGRGMEGKFVLNTLRLSTQNPGTESAKARFVRVELPGEQRILSLAEVQVFSKGKNIAPNGKADQSSTDFNGPASRAIDDNTNGDFGANSTTHTKTEDNPWWEVDLGADHPIDEIVVWNRTDGGVGTRLNNFKVIALDASRKVINETKIAEAPAPSAQVSLAGGQPVRLQNASADFSADGLEAAKAIDSDVKTGWSAGNQPGKAHVAIFEVAGKAGGKNDDVLVFTLEQKAGKSSTIGRFRLSVTSAKTPVRAIPEKIAGILARESGGRTDAEKSAVVEYYREIAPSLEKSRKQLAKLKTDLANIKPVAVPVMRELPKDRQRVSHVLAKGNFLSPGDVVDADFPKSFNAAPAELPRNRLGVARWLLSRDNPLTARVTVNRFWGQLFGLGIVETEEDFGTQGQLPSHQDLLDWLAVSFESPKSEGKDQANLGLGWDVKALLKTVVLSATYEQSSHVTPEIMKLDPRNRLLSHYPRRRLDAETVRDQALALSGLLSRKIGGPSVYPPQPDGLWRAAFNGQRTWETSKGDDRYRRGLYTFWRRTVPYPSMSTFDAPSRENCTMRRLPTNTPLQAFVTMNDPAFVEMAQGLGRRIALEGGTGTPERVRYGLKLVLARAPNEEQVQALMALYEKELMNYRSDAEAAKKLATEPLGALPREMDAAEQAAWTVVANVLLNLDGVLTKG